MRVSDRCKGHRGFDHGGGAVRRDLTGVGAVTKVVGGICTPDLVTLQLRQRIEVSWGLDTSE